MAKVNINLPIKDSNGGLNKNRLCELRNTGQQIYFQRRGDKTVICSNTRNKQIGRSTYTKRGKTEANKTFSDSEKSRAGYNKIQRQCWEKACRKFNYWGQYKTAHDAWVGFCMKGELGQWLQHIYGIYLTLEIKEDLGESWSFLIKIGSIYDDRGEFIDAGEEYQFWYCVQEMKKLYHSYIKIYGRKEGTDEKVLIKKIFMTYKEEYGDYLFKEELRNIFGTGKIEIWAEIHGIKSNIIEVDIPAECDYSGASYIYLKHKGEKQMFFTELSPASDIFEIKKLWEDRPNIITVTIDGNTTTAKLTYEDIASIIYELDKTLQCEDGIANAVNIGSPEIFQYIIIGEKIEYPGYTIYAPRTCKYCTGIYKKQDDEIWDIPIPSPF